MNPKPVLIKTNASYRLLKGANPTQVCSFVVETGGISIPPEVGIKW